MREKTKKIISVIVVVFIMLLPLSSNAAEDVPKKVLDACLSVVRIEAHNISVKSSGSGFIIKSDNSGTLIVTNAHVISEGSQDISVWVTNSEKQVADVVYISEQRDLAIIRLERIVNAKALKLATDVFQGMAVYAVGYPAAADILSEHEARVNQDATITDGLISATRVMRIVSFGPEMSILQINATINPGNSGGPLLNSEGEVVGVNTLSVTDSQGIFGAITSSELLSILKTAGIDSNVNELNISPWLIGTIVAFIICVMLLFVFIPVRHKKKKNNDALLRHPIPLINYISNWPKGLKNADIVSIMMPLANQLRDIHLNGKLFLKLSPHVLNATSEGVVLSDLNPPDFTITEFASPEQLSNGTVSVRSDVYSFFRVMEYLRGINSSQVDDLTVNEQQGNEVSDQSLLDKAIICGLSADANVRFSSMQEVIYELAPLNRTIPQYYTRLLATNLQNKRKRVIRRPISLRKIIFFTSIAIIGLFVGFESLCYFKAESYIEDLEFIRADENMRRIIFVHNLFPDEWAYLQAGVQMSNGDYNAAIDGFTLLGDYKKSAQYVDEAKYRKAAYLADQGLFIDASNLYSELSKYRDSQAKQQAIINRYAYYLLENNDYVGALKQFGLLKQQGYANAEESLKELYYYWACQLIEQEDYISAYEKLLNAGDYFDALAILPSLKETTYYCAVDLYRMGEYSDAKEGFTLLKNYLDTSSYLDLIDAHSQFYINASFAESKLYPLIGFEDAGSLIMKSDDAARAFMKGKFSGSGYYLKIWQKNDSEWWGQWDLPNTGSGDWYFQDGCFYTSDKATLRVEIIDYYSIRITSIKTNRSYLMYRQ